MTVKELIDAYTNRWPDSIWGPGHILLADYNVDDYSIAFVRIISDDWRFNSKEEQAELYELLRKLSAIPENDRDTHV